MQMLEKIDQGAECRLKYDLMYGSITPSTAALVGIEPPEMSLPARCRMFIKVVEEKPKLPRPIAYVKRLLTRKF